MQFRPCYLLTVQGLNYQTVACYLINWKFVVCFSTFFPTFFLFSSVEHFCVFVPTLSLNSDLNKKAKGTGWSVLIPLQGLFLLFFSVNCLFTFKLFILRSFTHTWQYFEEWGKYRIRKLFSVKCHGKMACYLVYLFPIWIYNIIFCPWQESSFPFFASADLNCCRRT